MTDRTSPSRLHTWIAAMRVHSLPLAMASIFMGTSLAAAHDSASIPIFILSTITALLLQILSNLADDYGDWVHGADHEGRIGPPRAVQSGQVTPRTMRRVIGFSALISAVFGLALIGVAFDDHAGYALLFVILGGCAIGAAITYTVGRFPYGYRGLGDLMVLIFYGWVAVFGSCFLHTRSIDWRVMLPATSAGLLATGMLNVNNLRDIESDRVAGKYTIPARLGPRRGRLYHWALVIGAAVASSVYVLLVDGTDNGLAPYLFVITFPLLARHGRAVWRASAYELDRPLKEIARLALLFVIMFGIGQMV